MRSHMIIFFVVSLQLPSLSLGVSCLVDTMIGRAMFGIRSRESASVS